MLRLYLDECVTDADLAAALRAAGHSVLTALEAGTISADDDEQLGYAADRQLVLVTEDQGFMELHEDWQQAGRTHSGILLIYEDENPAKNMSHADILRAIANLERSGIPIADGCHNLNHWQ